jgi:hypothetical protein
VAPSSLGRPLPCLLTNPSTQENQAHSPFLRLPAELRNLIYELSSPTTLVKVHPHWDDPRYYPDNDGPRGIIAFLQTCHQINGEAMQFFLSTSTFDTELCSLPGFLSAFGPERTALVTSIVVDLFDVLRLGREMRNTGMTSEFKALKHVHLLIGIFWFAGKQDWTLTMCVHFGKEELVVTTEKTANG